MGILNVKGACLRLTEVHDENRLPFIKRELKKLDGQEIVAGIPLDDDHLQLIAGVNEQGAEVKNIPPRPFVRYSFDQGKDQWADELMDGIWDIMRGNTVKAGRIQNRVGKSMQATIKKAIVDWKVPPNAEITVALKGFNDPLVESGHMRDSIMYTIKKKGDE